MIRIIQLLLLIALILIIWNLARRLLSPPPSGDGGREDSPQFKPTQRCARCGTHVPRDQIDTAGQCLTCAAKPR